MKTITDVIELITTIKKTIFDYREYESCYYRITIDRKFYQIVNERVIKILNEDLEHLLVMAHNLEYKTARNTTMKTLLVNSWKGGAEFEDGYLEQLNFIIYPYKIYDSCCDPGKYTIDNGYDNEATYSYNHRIKLFVLDEKNNLQ